MDYELETIINNLKSLTNNNVLIFERYLLLFDYIGPVVDYAILEKLVYDIDLISISHLPFFFNPLLLGDPDFLKDADVILKVISFDLSSKIKTIIDNLNAAQRSTKQIYVYLYRSFLFLLYDAQFHFSTYDIFTNNLISITCFVNTQIKKDELKFFDRYWIQYVNDHYQNEKNEF